MKKFTHNVYIVYDVSFIVVLLVINSHIFPYASTPISWHRQRFLVFSLSMHVFGQQKKKRLWFCLVPQLHSDLFIESQFLMLTLSVMSNYWILYQYQCRYSSFYRWRPKHLFPFLESVTSGFSWIISFVLIIKHFLKTWNALKCPVVRLSNDVHATPFFVSFYLWG